MEKVNVDSCGSVSTAAIDTTSRDFDKHFTFLNRNLVVNGQTELERKSLNTIQNVFEGKVNTVFESNKHDLLNQHDDGLPIITSVFSLATNITEIKQENPFSNVKVVGTQFPLPPVITETVIQNQQNHSPGSLPFVVKCEPGGFITVSSPTRTTLVEAKNQDMKFGTEKPFTDCYKIPSSSTYVSDPCLSTNQHNLPAYIYDTGKGSGHLEPKSKAFDNKSEDTIFDKVTSCKQDFQYPFEYNNFTARQLSRVEMRDTPEMYNNDNKTEQAIMTREEKIHRLKDLLRQKEEKLEKIRFHSKKKTLSATIDKLKLNLLKRNNMVCHHTEEQPSNATTLNPKLYGGDKSVNLVQNRNAKKETTTTKNTKYQRYETKSSVHLTRISTSASTVERKKHKVDDKFGLGITNPQIVGEKRKKELEVNDISNVLFQGEKQSGFPKRLKGGPKETSNRFKTLADLLS